jgi:hypothetical protein
MTKMQWFDIKTGGKFSFLCVLETRSEGNDFVENVVAIPGAHDVPSCV